MPNKCFSCGFTYIVGGEVSLHRLPTDKDEQEKWLKRIGFKGTLLENKIFYLCSNHFSEDCFRKINLRRHLIPGSLPLETSPSLLGKDEVEKQVTPEPESDFEFQSPPKKLPRVDDTSPTTDSEETLTLTSPSKCASASSSATSFSGKRRIVKLKKRRFLANPRYIGDYSEQHLKNPLLRKKFLKLAQTTTANLKKRNMLLERQVNRLKSSIRSLQELTRNIRQNFSVEGDMESALNVSTSGSARQILEKLLRGPKRQKYSEELRAFALTLHYYSPRAYSYVRSTFNYTLPAPRTMRTWYSKLDGGPGFNESALKGIKDKVTKAKSDKKELVGALLMDEISIRKLIEWNEGKFKGISDFKGYIGKQDHEMQEAREVLVFMIVFLNENYKVPVAYFFTNGVVADDKASILLKLLGHLENTGLRVATITFDGLSSNLKMAEILGADFSNPSSLKTCFSYPPENQNRHIYFILDPSHMIKLVRNTFGSKKTLIHDQINNIEWRHIDNLVKFQNTHGLNAATKIGLRHINYGKEKMKVKLATQILSKSVSDALLYLEKDLKVPDFFNAQNTAKFCEMFNNLFDVFNCRNLYSKSIYGKALSKNTNTFIFSFLNESYNYITNLNLTNGRKLIFSDVKTGFLGFLINIVSLNGIYEEFINCQNPPLDFLLTYKISQDHLEIFFSSIRSRGGFNNNPSARQFEAAFKRLLLHNHVKASGSANISSIDDTILLPLDNSTVDSDNTPQIFEAPAVGDHTYVVNSKNWHLSEYTEDVVVYIAGFVVIKVVPKINCQICVSILRSNSVPSKLQLRKTLGGLSDASQFVVNICTEAEKTFRWAEKVFKIFDKKYCNLLPRLVLTTMNSIDSKLFDVFNTHLFDDEPERNHGLALSKLILETYFNLRIHHELKNRGSERLDTNRLRSRLTKTITFINQ